jgi:hypothetical protein
MSILLKMERKVSIHKFLNFRNIGVGLTNKFLALKMFRGCDKKFPETSQLPDWKEFRLCSKKLCNRQIKQKSKSNFLRFGGLTGRTIF